MSTTKTTPTGAHTKSARSTATKDPGHSKDRPKNTKSYFIYILAAILGGMLLYSQFKNSLNTRSAETSSNSDKNSSENIAAKWVFDRSIEVDFTGDYTDATLLPSAEGFALSGATQPYMVINQNGKEFSGEKNEDLSSKLRNSHANERLRFHSTNGKMGHITVNLYFPK